ncbi:hypothetical protein SO802_006094 [Lithocarpus litseifolius]|uniref:Uncharacterized protein n=1 Tax=Lithocarpus litseifolius TaxID=425828 RepID=A0AAW2DQI4_9ROSI
MEVRKLVRAKAKTIRLPCPSEPLKLYTATWNGKFVKAGDSQCYREFPELRFDPMTRIMVLGFKILLDCNSKSNSSSDSSSNDSGHSDDDNNNDSESNNSEDYDSQYSGNDWGVPPSDREDEDANLFYEEYNDDVDYYDEDIKDHTEANRWSDTNSDQYWLINVLEDAREEVEQPNDVDYEDFPYGRPSI